MQTGFQRLRYADFLTLTNALTGLTAGTLALLDAFIPAVLFFTVSLALDFVDGIAARTNAATAFGRELDSLSDIIAFGVAPVFFALSLTRFNAIVFFTALFYVYCGVLRLARFNIQKKKRVFFGLPIPVAGALAVATAFLTPAFTPTAFVVLGIAMTLSFKIKKPFA